MDVASFMSRLRSRRTSRVTFKLDYPADEIAMLLRETARDIVCYWDGSYIEDNEPYIRQLAGWLTDPKAPGAIIFGVVGNGKTTLMKAVSELVNNLGDGSPNRWITTINAMELARLAKTDEEKMRDLIRKPLLAVDDLGIEQDAIKSFGNILNPAVEMLLYRYQYRLPTLLTTNLKPAEIRQRYGDRVADRMNEMFIRIIIKNETYRTRNNG